jgi:hypothetical protein
MMQESGMYVEDQCTLSAICGAVLSLVGDLADRRGEDESGGACRRRWIDK